MNVLQVNSVCGIGSTGRIASDLHGFLVSNGHQSTVAFGRYKARMCDSVIPIGSRWDVLCHVAQTRVFDGHGFGSRYATVRFLEEIRAANPDVVHLHNVHGYYVHIGVLFEYLRQAGVPVIWTLHDCWAFTGHCAYFDLSGCVRWKTACCECPLKHEYPRSVLRDGSKWNYLQKKAIFRGVPNLTLVTPSRWLAGLVKQSFLQDYAVTTINNGIDLNVFKPATGDCRTRLGIGGKFVVLGVASVWGERKGYEYVLKVAERLDNDCVVVLVGVNAQQKKRLPASVIGITTTDSPSELAEIYSTADVFVNPTLEDNFPTTNLESLACGTPVITFDTGGSPESLDEGCGIVVAKKNLDGLLAAIKTVRSRGKDSYSFACRATAISKFDKNTRFAEYMQLYERVVSRTV